MRDRLEPDERESGAVRAFAVVHDDWPRFPYYLTMGLVAGWLVRRYRSVGPAIALHMLNNAIATALTLWR